MDKNRDAQLNVSVVVAVYNTEKYVERCIHSIERQNLNHYEIVVVDDASEDSTLERVKKCAAGNSHIRLYQNTTNRGAGYTKNKALSLCRGKYVCFVDSDDWLMDGALGEVYHLAEDVQCDDVYYGMKSINEGEKISGNETIKPQIKKVYDVGICFFEQMLDRHKVTVAAWHHFVRRDIITEEVRFSEGTINDDWMFSVKLYKNIKKLVVLGNTYYRYFHRKQGSVTNIAKEKSLIAEIYQQACAVYNDQVNLNELYSRVQEKVFLYRMIELQNEIFYKKAGWNEELREVLQRLDEDLTQKKLFDRSKNLSLYGIVDNEMLIKAQKVGNVYIYGAGAYGKDVYRVLTENVVQIKSFVTTDENDGEILKVPVCGIHKLVPEKDSLVLVAVSARYQDDIMKKIREKGFANYGRLIV